MAMHRGRPKTAHPPARESHALAPRSTLVFSTQCPTLSSEKASASRLYAAYEVLKSRAEAWCGMYARGVHSLGEADSVAHAGTVDIRPVASAGSCSASTAAGSILSDRHAAVASAPMSCASVASSPISGSSTTAADGQPDPIAQAIASAAVAMSTADSSASSSSGRGHASHDATTTNSNTRTKVATNSIAYANTNTDINTGKGEAAPPPTTSTLADRRSEWLDAQVEAFFEHELARAIQERETALVNVMHECFQRELQDKEVVLQAQCQLAGELAAQVREFDKVKDHFQSKVDRRVAENNALRKDFYKQLLMLRELVNKHKSDPRTLRALDEVISSVAQGKDKAVPSSITVGNPSWAEDRKGGARSSDGAQQEASSVAGSASTTPSSALAMRREKEKWEQRARETMAQCQQLQEQVLILKQQLEEARGMDGDLWFSSAQHGLYERQRIIDCVYKSKCSWEDVGDSIVELLNNETVWEAVEDSAYREKTRVSRGLEALLLRVESVDVSGTLGGSDSGSNSIQTPAGGVTATTARATSRRRPAFSQAGRLVACRTCNGCGYLDATEASDRQRSDSGQHEDDSYLRKTLAQVLELKAALDESSKKSTQLEQDLHRTVVEGAKVEEKLARIEFIRSHGVDSCIQTDLDAEEDISLDDIMNSYNNPDNPDSSRLSKRGGARWKQYEHLIVELKNSLSERESGLVRLRTDVADAQGRLISVQRTSQKEQEQLQQEILTLKASLAMTMKNRNDAIEEKQAAVKMLLGKLEQKKAQPMSLKAFNTKEDHNADADGDHASSNDSNNESSNSSELGFDDEPIDEHDEVKRSEIIARRYSEAISRVQQEYDEQQNRLKHAEDELHQETDKRKRTNSIMLGSIAVSMTSHPRDLFKALSTTHGELLSLRRSSQRASALQTDRLLTLTTHLAHMSEELCMVKKRTSTEIEFWKLDCEKLQNMNKMLTTNLQKSQQHLQAAKERGSASIPASAVKVCMLCEKHAERLMQISSDLLTTSCPSPSRSDSARSIVAASAAPANVPDPNSAVLTERERRNLSAILLDLEDLYSTLSTSKQQNARVLLTKALIGADVSSIHSNLSGTSSGIIRNLGHTPVGTESRSASFQKLSQAALESIHEVAKEDFGSLCESNGEHTTTSPTRRLFRLSISEAASQQNPDEADPFLLHGSSLSGNPSDRDQPAPSHHKKKIVRKVLSEQEVLQRQRARAARNPTSAPSDYVGHADGGQQNASPEHATVPSSSDEATDYLTYIDGNGREVHYVDIEVNDIVLAETVDVVVLPQSTAGINAGREVKAVVNDKSPRRSGYTIEIPSPTEQRFSPPKLMLLGASDEIEKDPEVIAQLRDLVNQNATTKEQLAIMNWKVLMSHLRSSREQKRLEMVNCEFKRVLGKTRPSLDGRPPQSMTTSVRNVMQKLLQYRETYLDATIRARNDLRKLSRRIQAHLIHSVSSVLASLSRRTKTKMHQSDTTPLVHFDPERSPNRKPSPTNYHNRPYYPSARVNLSELPTTQQISSPSFPLAKSQISPHKEVPSSARPRTPPSSAPVSPVKAINSTTVERVPSVFENDNCFPVRTVKFIPSGDGEELSLVHSTSSISSPAHSPSRHEARRRPTHSAGHTRSITLESTKIVPEAQQLPAIPPMKPFSEIGLLGLRRPVRPQSSPAGMGARLALRTQAQLVPAGDYSLSNECRPPENTS